MNEKLGATLIVAVETDSPFLEDCLRSACAQTRGDRELICVLGSGCTPPAAEFPGLLVRHAEEGGFAACVNRCLDGARGSFCAFVHPDDYLKPDYLEKGLAAAERANAQLVLFETGERGRKTGTLRSRFISLRKELLPPEPCFTPRKLAGNPLLLARTPSWLTLFRTDFLREHGLRWLEDAPNNLYLGRGALALAERACAVREPSAWMHETKFDLPPIAREMEALFDKLNESGCFDALAANFAHALLAAVVKALKEGDSESDRVRILAYLSSEAFGRMRLLGRPAAFYRYPVSQRNAAFLEAVRRRSELAKTPAEAPAVQTLASARNEKPLVSVILPVYNTRAFLEDSLNSILGQTLRDLELICVDDGSTDGSGELLLRAAEADGRVAVLRQANRGPSAARNRGLACARGTWVYFMDSDDTLPPDALGKLCEKAEKDGLDLLLFNGENIYDEELPEDRRRKRPGQMRFTGGIGPCGGADMLRRLLENDSYFPAVWMELVRREYLTTAALRFDESIRYAEDEPYSYALTLGAGRCACVEDSLYRRRLREGSITTEKTHFEKALGCFRGCVLMSRTLLRLEETLAPENRAAAARRLAWAIGEARALYRELPETERAEAYGLGEEFTLFRMIVGDAGEAWASVEDGENLLRETLRRRETAAEAIAAAEKRLPELTAEAESVRARLRETELLAEREENRLRALTDTLRIETLEKNLRETQERLRETQTALQETQTALQKTNERLLAEERRADSAEKALREELEKSFFRRLFRK